MKNLEALVRVCHKRSFYVTDSPKQQARTIRPIQHPWHACSTAGTSRCLETQHAKPGVPVGVMSGILINHLFETVQASLVVVLQACLWTPAELSGWLDKKGKTEDNFDTVTLPGHNTQCFLANCRHWLQ